MDPRDLPRTEEELLAVPFVGLRMEDLADLFADLDEPIHPQIPACELENPESCEACQ